MDSFKEQIVTKVPTSSDKTMKALTLAAGFAVGFLIVMFSFRFVPSFAIISIFFGLAAVYGAFWLTGRYDVEYEYIFTNGEIDVDKITAQRTRKRLVTVDVKKATDFGLADDSYTVPEENTLVLAGSGEEGCDEYYIETEHKSLGRTTLIFTPDEDMLELVKQALPRSIKK